MAKAKMVKEKGPQTYEEHLAFELDRFSRDREGLNPESNYPFRVGEKVRVGNLTDCRVEEILDDGKVLHISRQDCGETYGKKWDNNRRLPIIYRWYDVDPIEPVTETNFARPRITANFISNDLRGLLFTCYHRGLIDSPEYQRGYVWTLEDKQRLIQSIFDRSDIGKFVVLSHPYPENRLEIVDGKQRLGALREFYEGRFEFKGKNWFQLGPLDKNVFEGALVQVCQIDSDSISKSDILWLFLSINVGGVPQTEEHIQHARKLYEQALKEEGKN